MVQQKKGPSHTANGANKREQSNMSFQKKDSSDARVMAGKADGKAPNGKHTSQSKRALSRDVSLCSIFS